ncbi:MAG: DUF5777 family beta-barrel protein [Bacteroidota bacterium]
MLKIIKPLLLLLLCLPLTIVAQDVNLDSVLTNESQQKTPETEYAYGTFKSTTISNGHSVETLTKGVMEFVINHRFGTLNGGLYEWFGLDNATVRIAFDYGLTDDLMIGLGHASFDKQYDGFIKYKILKQSKGVKNMPFTLDIMGSLMVRTTKDPPDQNYKTPFKDRVFYSWQLLAARKFSESFSLQFMPTLVHYNLVSTSNLKNNIISLGIGGRQKITKRMAVNAEWYYNLPNSKMPGTKNSLCLGWDIETGGHVFQLIFTNGTGIAPRPFITETMGTWGNGDIHFGFNVHRAFQICKPKKKIVQ